jgi:hypothetical protein
MKKDKAAPAICHCYCSIEKHFIHVRIAAMALYREPVEIHTTRCECGCEEYRPLIISGFPVVRVEHKRIIE